jgi:hypothetical protein
MMKKTEQLRQSFKPVNIRILLIGESAPESGQFFYYHSRMTKYISKTFEQVFNILFRDDSEFLKYFQDKGCYLDDLSPIPVNKMSKTERVKTLKDSIEELSKRICSYNPTVIVIVLKKIDKYVKKAIDLSEVRCPVYTLPFPGNGHQNEFIQEFSKILKAYLMGET